MFGLYSYENGSIEQVPKCLKRATPCHIRNADFAIILHSGILFNYCVTPGGQEII